MKSTIFLDKEGHELAPREEGLLNLPLKEGMIFTFEGLPDERFEVIEWQYHHGGANTASTLKIILKKVVKRGMDKFIHV